LHALHKLDVSNNYIYSVDGLNIILGNIQTLILHHNNISTLQGFSFFIYLFHLIQFFV